MTRRLTPTFALTALAFALAVSLSAVARPAAQEQSGMQGFQVNRDQPVKIESQMLEVRDKQRQATFSGGVTLTQGDTVLKCKTLVVYYEDTAAAPAKKGAPAQSTPQGAPQAQKGSGGNQQIKRAEAMGDVLVVQKDQTASGDKGIYDLKANSITLTGNVVVTQGQNVMKGERMVVELATGFVRVESGKGGGPVQMLVMPSAAKDAPAPAKDAKSAPPQPAKAAPKGPIKIN
jgi:lipopolysaccharide export system protein LptA